MVFCLCMTMVCTSIPDRSVRTPAGAHTSLDKSIAFIVWFVWNYLVVNVGAPPFLREKYNVSAEE